MSGNTATDTLSSTAHTSISSTAQRASAVATTIVAEATGFAALSESYEQPAPSQSDHLQPDSKASDDLASGTSNLRLGEDKEDQEVQTSGKQRWEEEEQQQHQQQQGEERPPQTQKGTGTQSNIQTSAGLGTTVSADADVQAAVAKERGQEPPPQPSAQQEEAQSSPIGQQPKQHSQGQSNSGTANDIETSAGIGTTVSPDDDVQAAFAKERENYGQAQPIKPNTDAAGSASKASPQGSGIPTAAGDGTTLSPDDDVQAATSHKPSKIQDKHESSPSSSENSNDTTDTPATAVSQGHTARSEEGKVGWKTKLKGQAKVVAGKITRNEEKIELGREIKAGHQ